MTQEATVQRGTFGGGVVGQPSLGRRAWRLVRQKPLGAVSLLIVVSALVIAIPPVTDFVAPYGYSTVNLGDRLASPSPDHWLGADQLGRDVLSRILYGTQVAVFVSFGAVALAEVIAILIGLWSGYYLGWFDKAMQRVVDVIDALPGLLLLITVLGIMGSGLWSMIIAMGVLLGPSSSRLIRGQVLSISRQPYVEASVALGARDRRIMLRHILPNIVPLILVSASLRVGIVVLLEASLSFLGFGLQPPFPSWGQMLSAEGREFMRRAPWLAIFPGLAIGLLVFGFNMLGDALRDILDPRLRGQGRR